MGDPQSKPKLWAVEWYAYPDGARVSSRGTEYIEADSAIQAEAIAKARWPGIEEVSAHPCP